MAIVVHPGGQRPRGAARPGTTRLRVVLGDPRRAHAPTSGEARVEARWPVDDGGRRRDVVSDLVAYLIVAVPDARSVAEMVPSLLDLVEHGTVRLLDVVVISRSHDGEVEVRELEASPELAGLAALDGDLGGLLTEHDIELVSVSLQPGTTGLVLVIEDRWAAPLSAAARRAGGGIFAGERIPASRIEAAMSGQGPDVAARG